MKLGLLVVALLAVGCGSPPPAVKKPSSEAAKTLTAKLKEMTPEQRKQYLRQHPEEAMAAIGGAGPKTR